MCAGGEGQRPLCRGMRAAPQPLRRGETFQPREVRVLCRSRLSHRYLSACSRLSSPQNSPLPPLPRGRSPHESRSQACAGSSQRAAVKPLIPDRLGAVRITLVRRRGVGARRQLAPIAVPISLPRAEKDAWVWSEAL